MPKEYYIQLDRANRINLILEMIREDRAKFFTLIRDK